MSRANKKAVRLIEFLETLVITEGARAGDALVLMAWQKKYIRGVFARPGNAALSIARGNGKSTLVATVTTQGQVTAPRERLSPAGDTSPK